VDFPTPPLQSPPSPPETNNTHAQPRAEQKRITINNPKKAIITKSACANGAKELSKSFVTAHLAILQTDLSINSPQHDAVINTSPLAKKQLNPGPLARSPWALSIGPIRRDHLAATQFYQWASSASTDVLERFAIVSHIIFFFGFI
jgi:hypothetical protein